MIYGYVRVSTLKQNTERQVRNILDRFPDAVIYEDIYTRTKFKGREDWEKLFNLAVTGDIIVFDSVSRMSGNPEEGFAAYQALFERGVELIFLKEPHINTSVYKKALDNQIALTGTKTDILLKAINEYLMELAKEQIQIAFEQAEKEVLDLHRRTIEGLETARRAGRIGGRPKLPTEIQKRMYLMYFGGEHTVAEVVEACGIARATLYNYIEYWKENPDDIPVKYHDIYAQEARSTPGRPGVPDETIEEIQDIYENTEWSVSELANYYNLSESTIKKYCTGIKKRQK